MEVQAHHVKTEICATRPIYREGKIPKSVKVSLDLRLLYKVKRNIKYKSKNN